MPQPNAGIFHAHRDGDYTTYHRDHQPSTGEDRLFDVTTLLKFPAFKSLANTEIQNSAKIDHGILTWDDGRLDYATESLYCDCGMEWERDRGRWQVGGRE